MVSTKQKQSQHSTMCWLDKSFHQAPFVPGEGLYQAKMYYCINWLCFCFAFSISLIKLNAVNILEHKCGQVFV